MLYHLYYCHLSVQWWHDSFRIVAENEENDPLDEYQEYEDQDNSDVMRRMIDADWMTSEDWNLVIEESSQYSKLCSQWWRANLSLFLSLPDESSEISGTVRIEGREEEGGRDLWQGDGGGCLWPGQAGTSGGKKSHRSSDLLWGDSPLCFVIYYWKWTYWNIQTFLLISVSVWSICIALKYIRSRGSWSMMMQECPDGAMESQ